MSQSTPSSSSMLALRFHGNQDVRIDSIPRPSLPASHIRIKLAWCGICGSDLHEYRIGPTNTRTTPHPLTHETLPSVCGHEMAGTVAELHPGYTGKSQNSANLKVGDKVVVFPILTCHRSECTWCREECYGLCPYWGFLGYSGIGGGMAEEIVVNEREVFRVPDSVGLDVAALVEPLAVGWHAVRMAGINLQAKGGGQSVNGDGGVGEANSVRTGVGSRQGTEDVMALVLGAGPIGVSTIHALVAHGVSNIIVSEPSAARQEQAKIAGAKHVLNPITDDVAKFVRREARRAQGQSDADEDEGEVTATGQSTGTGKPVDVGLGAHAVFECAGIQSTFSTALDACRGNGTIVNIAIYEHTELKWTMPNMLNKKQIKVVGSNVYTWGEYQEVIDAIADGRIRRPETMITGKVPIEKAVEEGFNVLLTREGLERNVKILVGSG